MGYTDTDYCTLDELKDWLAGGAIADTVDDDKLQVAITAASRSVDLAAGRHFGVDASVVARIYSAPTSDVRRYTPWPYSTMYRVCRETLDVDDIQDTTGLIVKFDADGDGTYGRTLTIGTEFRLGPVNNAAEGRPFTQIIFEPGVVMPWFEFGVQVTAKFGWSAVPDVVKQATLIQASRLFGRRVSPFGVAGSSEYGDTMSLLSVLDPTVGALLQDVRRYW